MYKKNIVSAIVLISISSVTGSDGVWAFVSPHLISF